MTSSTWLMYFVGLFSLTVFLTIQLNFQYMLTIWIYVYVHFVIIWCWYINKFWIISPTIITSLTIVTKWAWESSWLCLNDKKKSPGSGTVKCLHWNRIAKHHEPLEGFWYVKSYTKAIWESLTYCFRIYCVTRRRSYNILTYDP